MLRRLSAAAFALAPLRVGVSCARLATGAPPMTPALVERYEKQASWRVGSNSC
jgi:hypothetical protein